ncbi:hypothetical protein Bca4012_092580 [Brassica carinata]
MMKSLLHKSISGAIGHTSGVFRFTGAQLSGWLLRLVSGSLIDLRTQGEEVTHVLGERDGKEMRNHEAWRYAARKFSTATVSKRSKSLASLTGDIPLAYDDQFEKPVWPWKGILVNIPTKKRHDGLCCTGESGPQLKDELIRRGFNPIRVRTVWDCFGHSGTGIVEFNRDWNGLNDALLFKKAYQEDGHGKKDWLSGGGAAYSIFYARLANTDDYYRAANYIGEYLGKMGDLKSISRFAEEEARKDHKLVVRLNVISENIQSRLRMLEEKFSKTSIKLKCETEEKDKILHGYNQGGLNPIAM